MICTILLYASIRDSSAAGAVCPTYYHFRCPRAGLATTPGWSISYSAENVDHMYIHIWYMKEGISYRYRVHTTVYISLFSRPCTRSGIGHCVKSSFFVLATNTLNVRNNDGDKCSCCCCCILHINRSGLSHTQ